MIKSISTTEQNFQLAYDLLVSRYENKGAIIQSHIWALLDTPKVTTPSSIELWKLHHHIISNINALKSLKQPVDQWDPWLVTLLCSRMDRSTVGEWYLDHKCKDLASFIAVEQFLVNRIAAYEAGEINLVNSVEKGYTSKTVVSNLEKRVLLAQETADKSSNMYKCALCNEKHWLYQCNQFKNMSV